jgi:hypothetical protein
MRLWYEKEVTPQVLLTSPLPVLHPIFYYLLPQFLLKLRKECRHVDLQLSSLNMYFYQGFGIHGAYKATRYAKS